MRPSFHPQTRSYHPPSLTCAQVRRPQVGPGQHRPAVHHLVTLRPHFYRQGEAWVWGEGAGRLCTDPHLSAFHCSFAVVKVQCRWGAGPVMLSAASCVSLQMITDCTAVLLDPAGPGRHRARPHDCAQGAGQPSRRRCTARQRRGEHAGAEGGVDADGQMDAGESMQMGDVCTELGSTCGCGVFVCWDEGGRSKHCMHAKGSRFPHPILLPQQL